MEKMDNTQVASFAKLKTGLQKLEAVKNKYDSEVD